MGGRLSHLKHLAAIFLLEQSNGAYKSNKNGIIWIYGGVLEKLTKLKPLRILFKY